MDLEKVREAADRLESAIYENRTPSIEDAKKVARFAATMLDETPITGEWLESIGFDKREVPAGGSFNYWHEISSLKEDGFYWSNWLSTFDIDGESWGVDLWSMPSKGGIGLPSAACKNRGEFIRLCKALGLPLTAGNS